MHLKSARRDEFDLDLESHSGKTERREGKESFWPSFASSLKVMTIFMELSTRVMA